MRQLSIGVDGGAPALALYLFLVTGADAQGLSHYRNLFRCIAAVHQ